MLLVSMLAILFVFSLAGMEIAWAIGLSAFIFILLSQLTDPFGISFILIPISSPQRLAIRVE